MNEPQKTVSLVLGSGGARGLAHIGVIKWLEENGYAIRSISGCSMGALIGGIYAAGKLDIYTDWVRAITKTDMLKLLDISFGQSGMVKGEKIINTLPNKWFIKHATNADIAIHEVFLTPTELVQWYGQSPQQALGVGTQIHTSPPAFGKVMSSVKPRHAIGYHFFNEEGTRYGIYDGVRQTYSGPFSLATDNMVWNITKDKITERMTVSPDQAWSVAGPTPPPAPLKEGVPDPLSDAMKAGRWNPAEDAQRDLVNAFKKEHNMK